MTLRPRIVLLLVILSLMQQMTRAQCVAFTGYDTRSVVFWIEVADSAYFHRDTVDVLFVIRIKGDLPVFVARGQWWVSEVDSGLTPVFIDRDNTSYWNSEAYLQGILPPLREVHGFDTTHIRLAIADTFRDSAFSFVVGVSYTPDSPLARKAATLAPRSTPEIAREIYFGLIPKTEYFTLGPLRVRLRKI